MHTRPVGLSSRDRKAVIVSADHSKLERDDIIRTIFPLRPNRRNMPIFEGPAGGVPQQVRIALVAVVHARSPDSPDERCLWGLQPRHVHVCVRCSLAAPRHDPRYHVGGSYRGASDQALERRRSCIDVILVLPFRLGKSMSALLILETLVGRHFETDSVYMFDRPSSPGCVKFGWTARSVEARLSDWSKCGYAPNLLLRVDNVPWAQRAEALTHHELAKEWRTERQCRGPYCGRKSHQEWFEVSKEKAQQVVDGWASVLKEGAPYGQQGTLKPQWRQYVKQAVIDGNQVTAQNLWEYHESARVGSTAHLVVPVSSARTLNLKEVEEEENGCLRLAEEKDTLATRVQEEELEQKRLPARRGRKEWLTTIWKAKRGLWYCDGHETSSCRRTASHKDEPSLKQGSSFLSPPQAPVVPIAPCPRFLLKALADVNSLPAASQTAA
ncbi:uncharacterized protein PG986_014291 [Apiospora aurea]|uniref:Bacteriophage T5 Orf172 DNA-binding domain-containing protein n=1 Tax=Apiospora aurea TaxID=335848 RepID=A0ABR1PSM8_9PEZI